MSVTMNSKIPQVDRLIETLTSDALARNDNSVGTWRKYKNDLEETKSILTFLPKKLTHETMVPLGSRALMRGKIVHTNEFLVNLGETWFVKRTASQALEICDRRINSCDEMLQRLEKERELIINKQSLSLNEDAFGSEGRPEIIEEVTEEEDLEWREQHRIREKEYRHKLSELRQKEKKPIETEEDLWSHLDELELQEELEDELNRLNAENSSEDETLEEITEEHLGENRLESSGDSLIKNTEPSVSASETNENFESSIANAKIKRKVSFVSELDNLSDDEPLRLEFKHSSYEPSPSSAGSNNSVLNSPSDIYEKYLEDFTRAPVSILKISKNPNKDKEFKAVEEAENINDLPEVIIKEDIKVPQPANVRKMSKFKASRMKK